MPVPSGIVLAEPASPFGDGEHGIKFDFRKIIGVVRRNIWFIVGILGMFLVIGLIITLLITPKYTAVSTLQIDQETDRILQSSSDLQPATSYQDADRFLQTQVDVLTSRAIAIRVAQSLNLFGDPKFFQAMQAKAPARPTSASARQVVREATLGLLTGNLEVELPRQSRVIKVSFQSADPALAARIANAYTSEFIRANLQRKYDSSAYARDFLSTQLASAKTRLEGSERALNNYARSARLIRTNDGQSGSNAQNNQGSSSITTASLVQLNQAANDARAARIAAEQKWRTASGAPVLNVPEVLGNPAVQQLLAQRAQQEASLRQERAKHLESFPTVRQLQAQVDETAAQINAIATSIRTSIRDDYRTAQLRESSLNGQVESFKNQTLAEQDRSVRYNILAREADTNRTLYDGLLQRYKELSAAAGISANNISLIDQADTPLGPSSPNLMLNMLIAFVAGLGVAGIVVFTREQLDDAIRVPEDVEQKLGLSVLGLIPMTQKNVVGELIEEPRSNVSEAYYALRTSLTYSTAAGLPRTILVTSARPSEGKSTTSFGIALSLARVGKRVVLVDLDLRRPSIHHLVGSTNLGTGMSDLLVSHEDPRTVAQACEVPGLFYITSGPIPPSPTELLASARMYEILEQLKDAFDVVICDGPPILGLADAPLLAGFTDGTVFVVESNRGHWGATKAAMRRLRTSSRGSVIGAVLTKFDAKRSGDSYTYYGYDYYQYGMGNKDEKAGKRSIGTEAEAGADADARA
ncbi:MAG: putative tyrosine-protein kinase in cps region [Sphingomonas bacterium]|nr:putative tyrosine-protein kinase in cps region [Sphingomonas bacterium]MDB5718447.1 putative tyrosine-protein kinase in cps region [Sphingomonas bacterium]